MRNLKFISMMMGCLAALCVTFTSCDDDDDSVRALTPTERQEAFEAVKGNYTGSLIYSTTDAKTNRLKNDTVDISWSITTDSTMTINQFPSALLAMHVTDSLMKEAIAAAPAQDLTCAIGFIKVSPSTFLINPGTPAFDLTYDGKTHKVQLPFIINNYYSFGQLYSNKQLRMQIVLAAVYEDGKLKSSFNGGVPFVFTTVKQ